MVNNALLNLQTGVRSNCDFNHGNGEIKQNVFPSLSENTMMSTGEMLPVVSDEELNEHICLLNKK